MWTKIKMAIAGFMQGRNGLDNIAWHALWGGLIIMLADSFLGTLVLSLAGNALYVYALFRVFSRNVPKRQLENQLYVQFTEKLRKETSQFFLRLKGMRTYKYFRCPACKTRLRLKRWAGEKHITCPLCKHVFDQKA